MRPAPSMSFGRCVIFATRDLLERAGERRRAGEHLVEDDPQRVHVDLRCDRGGVDLLGRHVRRRADDVAGLGQAFLFGGLAQAGDDPEVEDLHLLLSEGAFEDHVAGLEVAVHEALAVRLREAGGELLEDPDGVVRLEGRALLDAILERDAVEEAHHEVDQAALRRPVVPDGHDVAMGDGLHRVRLAFEAGGDAPVGRHLTEQHLDRALLVVGHPGAAEHHTGAADADQAVDAVPREDLALEGVVAGDEGGAVEGAVLRVGGEHRKALGTRPHLAGAYTGGRRSDTEIDSRAWSTASSGGRST